MPASPGLFRDPSSPLLRRVETTSESRWQIPRAVTPTARARREGSSPLEEEVEEREEEVEVDELEFEFEELRSGSRSVTSHQGPIVLARSSMPRSAASRCTSAKVSKGGAAVAAGEGGGEEGEAGEEEEGALLLGEASGATIADDGDLFRGRKLGASFIRGADSDRETLSDVVRGVWRRGKGARGLMVLLRSKKEE